MKWILLYAWISGVASVLGVWRLFQGEYVQFTVDLLLAVFFLCRADPRAYASIATHQPGEKHGS